MCCCLLRNFSRYKVVQVSVKLRCKSSADVLSPQGLQGAPRSSNRAHASSAYLGPPELPRDPFTFRGNYIGVLFVVQVPQQTSVLVHQCICICRYICMASRMIFKYKLYCTREEIHRPPKKFVNRVIEEKENYICRENALLSVYGKRLSLGLVMTWQFPRFHDLRFFGECIFQF